MRFVRVLWIVGGLAAAVALIVFVRPVRVSADRHVAVWSKSEVRQRMISAAVVPAAKEESARGKLMKKATFGAGCFWGVEATFRRIPGVIDASVGYAGGLTENPTYKEVCTDRTGHAEVVQVEYDPAKVSYAELLDVFWTSHDPTQVNRQGPDHGTQYRTVIFYHDDEQKAEAEASKQYLDASGRFSRPIATQIVPAGPFYRAEDYHQRYLEKRGLEDCHL
jgi:peptide-methionine (S)-S-oxide reductase